MLRPRTVHVTSDKPHWLLLQTKQRLYEKDLAFSYHPFLPILGTGLVTANGSLWQTQRVLIGPALRVEILDDVITIAKSAVDRLSRKLARAKVGCSTPAMRQCQVLAPEQCSSCTSFLLLAGTQPLRRCHASAHSPIVCIQFCCTGHGEASEHGGGIPAADTAGHRRGHPRPAS
jgi:hypothetical protein